MDDFREHLAEGVRSERSGALERAVEHYTTAAGSPAPAVVSEALRRLSSVHRTRCDWDDALSAARRSAQVARQAGLNELFAEALNAEAAVHQSRGDFARAAPLLEQILTLTEDERVRGIALQNLGTIAAETGDLEGAEEHFLASYEAFRNAQYTLGEAFALNNSGRAALARGHVARADSLLRDALRAAKELGDMDLLALARLNLAEALISQGELAQADELASAALGYFVSVGNRWRQTECLRLLGDINDRQGHAETATRCYELGLKLAREIGAQREATELTRRLATSSPEP
jgi:tetratricopeptide (TPR) repeat protein